MTEQLSFQDIQDAIHRCAAGDWEGDAARTWLEQASDCLEADIAETIHMIQAAGYYHQSREEVECGLTALEAYREVLALLWDHQSGGPAELVEEAAELALQARETMRAALEQNLEASKVVSFSVTG